MDPILYGEIPCLTLVQPQGGDGTQIPRGGPTLTEEWMGKRRRVLGGGEGDREWEERREEEL